MARLISARVLFSVLIAAGIPVAVELTAEPSRTLPEARSTPVTRQEVWQAVVAGLSRQGVSEARLRAGDLDLPVAVPARAGRKLRVASACWDEAALRTQFRVECTEPGECLPFLVYLRSASGKSDGGSADVHIDAAAARRDASCRLQSRGPRAAVAAAPKPTVRAGERATAVFIADQLRMTASVTCLERGREGEVIRVRAADGHIFRARISGPSRLEALPQ